MILRVSFVLALLFGLGFWTTIIAEGGLVPIHMLLGLIVVGSLWYLGLAQAQRGGSLGLTLGTFALGLLVAIVGLAQTALKAALHSAGGVISIDVVHLLLGVLAIGLGEMCLARINRAATKVG
ncbi:MAG TPA: hypothetical protein VGN32_13795 [Ktedonobacterales bacterium]|jgi:hypothetical protein|nr:hypothetical protein [Ktedonobacterales bacterium]